ncbi:DUF456 domain-containing protein [Winogradskyella maritima]|uniref:DUF456 domain-containing protein n=1 Tax=Winogradskyella maritima TaxID=1517766 RepID=A0ABV8AEU5_9FLAO|nr:DUF456 domain-containing protein [Winogradskyella maritima]
MDIFLVSLALLFMVLGILGSFLPVLQGPLTSWFGFLALYFSNGIDISNTLLFSLLGVALFIWLLDYIIPALGTKRFGGSRSGMIGTTVGLIVGLFSPIPFGIVIGPFIGALIGELMHNSDMNRATKAAFGSFLGFVTSTFLKFIVAIIFFGFYIVKVSQHTGPWW